MVATGIVAARMASALCPQVGVHVVAAQDERSERCGKHAECSERTHARAHKNEPNGIEDERGLEPPRSDVPCRSRSGRS